MVEINPMYWANAIYLPTQQFLDKDGKRFSARKVWADGKTLMATIDIDKFRAALLRDDLGRANLFKVEFPIKIGVKIKSNGSAGYLSSIFGVDVSNPVRSITDAVTKEVLSKKRKPTTPNRIL